MSTETKQDEHTLNDSNDFFSAISAAIAAGDDDKVKELMSADNAGPTAPAETGTEEVVPPATDSQVPPEDGTPPPDDTQLATAQATPAAPQEPPVNVAALLQELHRVKSEMGRVGNVQSQLAKLQKVVDEQAALIAAMPKQPSKIGERLNSLKEIDPDMAETLIALRDEIAAARPVEPVVPEVDYEEDTGELERVRRVHPDVDLILVGGAARPAWEQWKSTLSPQQRAYAESARAEEFSLAYAAFKSALSAPAQPATSQPAEPTGADAAAIEQERKRKLAGGANAKAAPIRSVADETIVDPEEMVRKLIKDIQKRDNLLH